MPDITLHITTKNLSPDELQKLHRDISRIKQEFNTARRAALTFGLQIETTFKRGENAKNRFISDNAESKYQNITENAPESIHNHRFTSHLMPIIPKEVSEARALFKRQRAKICQIVESLPDCTTLCQIVESSPRTTLCQIVESLPENPGESMSPKTLLTLLPIADIRLPTPDTRHLKTSVASSSEGMSPETLLTRLPITDTRHLITNTRKLTPDTRHLITDTRKLTPDTRHLIAKNQQAIIRTISDVPNDLLNATSKALITIPVQTRDALQQLKADTAQQLREINESQVLSAQEKAARIEQIERDAAQRRKAIEAEANQAKIDSFNRVVQNFIAGIGRMIAAQMKLRVTASITNRLLNTVQSSGVLGAVTAHPVLGLALGATAVFASSFDDPINDALAQQAGLQQAQHRATQLGRRSALDLKDNFERGFIRETERHTASPQQSSTAPVVMNEIKLIIGGQEIKALYEETQRQIATGIISR